MKAIRILRRNISSAFKSVVRNFSLSIASIACTAITLILVALAVVLTINVNNFTSELESELTIVTYFKENTSEEDINATIEKIKALDGYESHEFKSKDDWKAEMQAISSELDTALSYIENPLLDSVVVKVSDATKLSATAKQIQKLDYIEDAKYGEGMVDEVITIFRVVQNAMVVIVVALILVTAFLISNTIKLTIFSRRNEIEIMRLVGTSNTVIRLPFIFEGFILGVLGSIIPIIITVYGYILLFDHFDGHLFTNIITLVNPANVVISVSIVILVLGSIVGMFGSYRAVRKYLKI